MEKKLLGVVIFSNDYYTDAGLAPLQWASVLKPSKFQILLVEHKPNNENQPNTEHQPNNQQIDKTKKFKKDGLFGAVRKGGKQNEIPNYKDWARKFEKYINKLYPEKEQELPLYKGPDIKKILEEAIDDFNLHTLVLGMPAAGSTTPPSNTDVNSGGSTPPSNSNVNSGGSTPPSNSDVNSGGSTPPSNIDLIKQLNSKCSVVLAKIDPANKPPTPETPHVNEGDDGSSTSNQSPSP